MMTCQIPIVLNSQYGVHASLVFMGHTTMHTRSSYNPTLAPGLGLRAERGPNPGARVDSIREVVCRTICDPQLQIYTSRSDDNHNLVSEHSASHSGGGNPVNHGSSPNSGSLSQSASSVELVRGESWDSVH